ncbi:hypothetical protein Athai_52600 [Actinocatenispora thailandica]|uniref:Uncharacterized protein n=1 Tax=Actinocatenispora thailandica TaxID=227318 RepID=A0A7R7DUP3_9ACTN|nr:hypothetical protein Athai_52600 [Actinocatenispora thailandica]
MPAATPASARPLADRYNRGPVGAGAAGGGTTGGRQFGAIAGIGVVGQPAGSCRVAPPGAHGP